MLVGESGRLYGTIGGGAVEHRSIEIAQKVIVEKASRAHDFSLTRDDVQALGMICGGDVRVFSPISLPRIKRCARSSKQLQNASKPEATSGLICAVSEGGSMALYDRSHGFTGAEMPAALTAHLKRKPLLAELDGASYYIEQVSSAGRVYVFGCGHVAQELVPVLSHVGFRCVAMDDREEFAQKALFPDTEEVLLVDFNHIDEAITVTAEDYACVMTRGHASDAVIQAQLLRTPASYIGVIGSARKKAGVYQKLREEYGYGDDDFARITSPIGLDIQAETPAEIVISIAAQLI